MESKTLINNSSVYKRAFKSLEYHLMNKFNLYKNCLSEQIKENLIEKDFKELRGFLYSLFDDNEILISVYPKQISKYRRGFHWEHTIKIDGIEIIEDSLNGGNGYGKIVVDKVNKSIKILVVPCLYSDYNSGKESDI
jgi:hypothetical protein